MPTPEQFLGILNDLEAKADTHLRAASEIAVVIRKAKEAMVRTDMQLPISQADVDHIISIQTPIYTAAKANSLATLNALP